MTDQKINILVVEDDPIIAEDLKYILMDLGYTVSGPAENASHALKEIKRKKPDICLLDVHLGSEVNGIQLARMIRDEYDVPFIFLTAFNDNDTIQKIKETGALGYLVKPVNEKNLHSSIELAFANYQNTRITNKDQQLKEPRESIFIKLKDRLAKFNLADIDYFEAFDNYAFLYSNSEKHILSSSLKQIEDKLSDDQFIRVHRSYIVNLQKIDGIGYQHLNVGEKEIPIGKTFREALLAKIDTL